MNTFFMERITFSYSSSPGSHNSPLIFEDFSLKIQEGSVTALLGPNGSGKSTLLGLLLGYLLPQKGKVSLFGQDIIGYTRSELGRQIGFVSQSGTLPFNYPVLDYLLLGRASRIALWETPSKKDLAAVNAAVETAGIETLADRNVQELSAGELQLVAVARALAQEPRVLLLDEPTSHLDPANALLIFRLMRRLAGEGLTVLFTTHDPLHARQAAEQAVLLRQGRLLFSGKASEGLMPDKLDTLYGVTFREALIDGVAYPFLMV
ncbi:ABC transporter ATP-binding protein [Marispirochaeta sp.]|jgi:iron complex transport system ATP-binding protein|uniref:ABC transporter ATP-binding protein n=1 Tax=Marispirochaeta sp. TaxID=2038653 RepID=UPI0029C7B65A|nr:ABC transporter ATP-binding protein [Marispirochaeta sp.]